MSDDRNENTAVAATNSLLGSLPTGMRVFIGGIFAFFFFWAGWMFLANFQDMLKKPCWKVETIYREAYKLNTCTGELQKITLEELGFED